MSGLARVEELCAIKDPFFTGQQADALFVAAMREVTAWHAEHSPFYRGVLAQSHVGSLESVDDLAKLPLIPADYFKTHDVLSIAREQVAVNFTSSGTTGQKSQMFFDARSLAAGQRMVDDVFAHFGWQTPETLTNYLLYSYETESESQVGTVYTDNFLCKYAPANESFAAIRLTKSGAKAEQDFEFDVFGCIRQLESYQSQGRPVRIFGFPAFLYFTLRRMRELRRPALSLPPSSLVILGGGWKGHAGAAIPKDKLYELVQEQLGLEPNRIRDSFGAVEHGIPYMECAKHAFHVPTWSRVVIRDVRTLKPLPLGEVGFLNFLTPFNTASPAHSLMMGDLAVLHDGSSCGCGIQTPYFEILGRAGTSKNRSCALAASDLLGRSS